MSGMMANNGKWSSRLAAVEDKIAALEKVNVLRGYGKATTAQAKAIMFVIKNMKALQELIAK